MDQTFLRLLRKTLAITWRSLVAAVKLTLYAAYGGWLVLRALYRLLAMLWRGRHMFRRTLHCPQGHEVPTEGRYLCAGCHTEYLGWIGRCRTCGAGADLTRCPVCGVGVRLPWEAP